MIQNLPVEIINKISYTLDQNDTLNLAYTSWFMYKLLLPRLYCSISIGSYKKVYGDNISAKEVIISSILEDTRLTKIIPVHINSVYSLKLFLKNVSKESQYGKYIEALFFCSEIPDIPEFSLLDYLRKIFPKLSNLKILNWFNIGYKLDLDLVLEIPYFDNMVELNGNFKLGDSLMNFPKNNLRSFNLSGFDSSYNLSQLRLQSFQNISTLVISKGKSISNNFEHYKNDTKSAIIELDNPTFMSNLFKIPLNHKLNLTRLTLKDISLISLDSRYLIDNINLEYLIELSIINCNEVLFNGHNNTNLVRRNPPSNLFLDNICPHLKSLKYLNLNLNNELKYNKSLLNFLNNLPSGLIKLNLIIEFNKFECSNVNLTNLMKSLKVHKGTLQFLNLNFNTLSNHSNLYIHKPNTFIYDISSLKYLSDFHDLAYISLPINQHQITNLLKVLNPLKRIKCLRLNLVPDHTKEDKSSILETSLINQDIIRFSNSLVKLDKVQQFNNLFYDFKFVLEDLNWLMFNVNQFERYVFECFNNQVLYRDGFDIYFDEIVNSFV